MTTEAEEIEAAFKLVCKKCQSDNVRIDIERGIDYGGEAGYSSGYIAIGCNDCGKNDIYISIQGARMSEIELPAPMYHDDGEEGWHYYTAEQVRAAILAEREANALKCDAEVVRMTEQGDPRAALVAGICAAAIRRGSV